jgi:mono/diheme cytochrome c family protein
MLVVAVAVMIGCEMASRQQESAPVAVALVTSEMESFRQFCDTVVPVFESRCGLKCHGVSPNDFEEFRHSADHAGFFYFPVDPETGRIPSDHASLVDAFHVTRGDTHGGDGHSGGSRRIDYGEESVFSPLLRSPMAVSLGGTPHRGLDVFYTSDDPDYLSLRSWVETELALRPTEKHDVPEEEIFFRDAILPVLVRNGCFTNSCHGPHSFSDLKYVLPLPSVDGKFDPRRDFSTKAISTNRKKMLGEKSRFANLGGDVRLSRLLVKNLPLKKGGVHQRGGNIQFFDSYSDPDVKQILRWLEMEKSALASRLRSRGKPVPSRDLGRLQGVAFIRGPRHQPREFFDVDQFWPGSDIFLRRMTEGESIATARSEPVNLTARFHADGSAEIQSFDVRYDGKAIVFSMRTDIETGFRLYELQLDDRLNYAEGSFRQMSFFETRRNDGVLVHCVDPIYTPGPNDADAVVLDDVAVAFTSNVAGDFAPSQAYALLGEADAGDVATMIDVQRTEAPGTFDGRRIAFVDGPNKGQWRTIKRHLQDKASVVGAKFELDRPLPEVVDRRTVYTIEQLEASNLPAFDLWRFVPDKQSDARGSFTETVRRMTFTSAQERRPTMRTTGEVMFTSVRNAGFQADRPVFNGAIFRVMAGGFDYHIQGGNRSRYPLFIDSRELPQGLEIRLCLDPRNLWGGGALMLADHGFGVHIEPENPVDNIPVAHDDDVLGKPLRSSSRRYLPALLPFFSETGKRAITATGQSPGGSLRDAFPLPDGTVLVSRVAEGFDHLDDEADPNWDVCLLRFEKSLQDEHDIHKVGPVKFVKVAAASTPESAEYCPRPIITRLKEKARTHQKFAPRTDGIKAEWVDGVQRMPDNVMAELECYDYPLLQSFLTHFAPVGKRDFRVGPEGPVSGVADPDRTFRYVRILVQMPPSKEETRAVRLSSDHPDPFATPVSQGVHARKQIVAEVPLESDGTFYAQIPPEVPLIIQGLNHHKMALHSMNRWFYVQPGEKLTFSIPRKIFPTLCTGCHGSLTGNSQHALGPPDVVSSASRVMATWDLATNRRRPPYNGDQPRAAYLTVDYRRDVQPILDQHCVSCHDGSGPEAVGLDLRGTPTEHYSVSYETLHMLRDPASGNHADKRFINEREALSVESYLIEKLLGRELEAPQELDTVGARHPSTGGLSKEELLTLIRWIDLGATFIGGDEERRELVPNLAQTQER